MQKCKILLIILFKKVYYENWRCDKWIQHNWLNSPHLSLSLSLLLSLIHTPRLPKMNSCYLLKIKIISLKSNDYNFFKQDKQEIEQWERTKGRTEGKLKRKPEGLQCSEEQSHCKHSLMAWEVLEGGRAAGGGVRGEGKEDWQQAKPNTS